MKSDDYPVKNIGGCRVRIQPGAQDLDIVRLMSLAPAALRQLPHARLVSEEANGFVLRLERERGRPRVYWKEFHPRTWFDPLKDRMRGSKAARAWQGMVKLQRVGIFTARLIAYGEAPMHGLFRHARSFIVTEEIQGAQSVQDFLESLPPRPTPLQLAQKRELMRELGRTIGRLHQAELYHHDLRLTNILWRPGASGRPRLYFIDTDKVVRDMPLPESLIVRNLMQINLFFLSGMTLTDRARMLSAYAEERVLDRETRLRLASKVFARLREGVQKRLQESETHVRPEPVRRGMDHLLKVLTPPGKSVRLERRSA